MLSLIQENRNIAAKATRAVAKFVGVATLYALRLLGSADDGTAKKLPEFVVNEIRVANDEPSGTLGMAVTALRFEPRVDVQARSFAEAQADVSVRGGVFESTGVRIGATAVADPQTGHYLFELPVAPEMLGAPAVATGAANAARGFNAGTGSVEYGWAPVRTGGRVAVAAGAHGYDRQEIYLSRASDSPNGFGGDVSWARSQSDGAIAFGDHDFSRVAARVQRRSSDSRSQTDLFAGYQHKFFGWPNLYTPFGFNETENLQTVLIALNHSWRSQAGSEFQAAAFYRRNKDDYEFNRLVPGASNPFQHTTWLRGLATRGRVQFATAALGYSFEAQRDRLESTALTFGRFNERSIEKVTLLPELSAPTSAGRVTARAGAAFDHSDRDGSAWSPIAELEWRGVEGRMIRGEYSEATQLPSYTALNSSATSGLFRGNPNLSRSRARNLELGAALAASGWSIEAAVFRRWDDQLVDWTFRRGVTARTANPVDTATDGIEVLTTRHSARVDLTFSYAWLHKRSDYGAALVDASFYALNFPEHRATAAIRWRVGHGVELRSDNEYRVQAPNFLRVIGGDRAVVSSLGLHFAPPALRGWEFSALVDNLWDSAFQEVPAVPASPRQWSVSTAFRW